MDRKGNDVNMETTLRQITSRLDRLEKMMAQMGSSNTLNQGYPYYDRPVGDLHIEDRDSK